MGPLQTFVENNLQEILVLLPLRVCSNCVVDSVSLSTKSFIHFVGGADMEFLARIEIVGGVVASLIIHFQMHNGDEIFHRQV